MSNECGLACFALSLESLNKTTKDKDILDSYYLSAHYLSHTKFGVEGSPTGDMNPITLFFSTFALFETEEFSKNSITMNQDRRMKMCGD